MKMPECGSFGEEFTGLPESDERVSFDPDEEEPYDEMLQWPEEIDDEDDE
jgi:hypothetical protein